MKYKVTFRFDVGTPSQMHKEVRKILEPAGPFELKLIKAGVITAHADLPELTGRASLDFLFLDRYVFPRLSYKRGKLRFACVIVENISDIELIANSTADDNRRGL